MEKGNFFFNSVPGTSKEWDIQVKTQINIFQLMKCNIIIIFQNKGDSFELNFLVPYPNIYNLLVVVSPLWFLTFNSEAITLFMNDKLQRV